MPSCAVKLETLGYLQLPPRIIERGGRPPIVAGKLAEEFVPENVTEMPSSIETRLVQTQDESRNWNGLIGNYHYLGLATPVGRLVRYLIYGDSKLLVLSRFPIVRGMCRHEMISWPNWASTSEKFVMW